MQIHSMVHIVAFITIPKLINIIIYRQCQPKLVTFSVGFQLDNEICFRREHLQMCVYILVVFVLFQNDQTRNCYQNPNPSLMPRFPLSKTDSLGHMLVNCQVLVLENILVRTSVFNNNNGLFQR